MTEVDVIRIPGARPVYKQKAEVHVKEQNWDDRFVLGRIPAYDATRDKHCVALVAAKKKKTVLAPGRIRRARSPSSTAQARPPRSGSVKGLATESKNLMRGNLVQKLKSDLVEELTNEGVPEELYGLVLKAIEEAGAKSRVTALARELEDLRNHRSIVKAVFEVIAAREQSILTLKQLAESGASRPLTEAEVRSAQEALMHHRLMTLHTIEHIAVFREHVYKTTQGDRKMFRVPIIWQGNNYILQLKSDTSFLAASCLADFFEFSKKSDPFFVLPASQGLKRGKLDLPFPPALINRVKAAETVILDEANALKENQRVASRDAPRRVKPPEYPQSSYKRPEPGQFPRPKPDLEDEEANQSPARVLTPRRIPSTESLARPVTRGKGEGDLGSAGVSAKRLDVEERPLGSARMGRSNYEEVSSESVVASKEPDMPKQPVVPMESVTLPKEPVFGKEPETAPEPFNSPPKAAKEAITVASIPLEIAALRAEIEHYISELPISIRESFWAPGSFDTLLKQTYPAFLTLNRAATRIGLLGFYIDTMATNVKRVFISHVSANSTEVLEEVLDACLEYIWGTYPCDEIRIAINYREIEGKMEADAQIKAIIASKKFRWKNLTNTADGRRVIIMAVLRPAEAPERPVQNSAFFSENLQVRYGVAAQVGEKSSIRGPAGLFSYLGVAACLQQLGGVEAAEMSHNELQLSLEDFHSRLPQDFEFPAFRSSKSDDISEALRDITAQNIDLPGLEPGLLTSTACSAIGLRFPCFDTCLRQTEIGVCEYIRISETEINCAEVGEKRIFLFPSDDKQFNLMIITAESGEKDTNALESAGRIISDLTRDQKAFNRTASEIWLPGFRATGKAVVSDVCGLQTASGTIKVCSEAYEIALQTPNHVLGGIELRPGELSVVIEDSFVIGEN